MTQKDSSASGSSKAPTNDIDDEWDQLAGVIESFCNAWESAPPEPELDGFAQQVTDSMDEEFQRIGLIELVKVDMEYRAKEEYAWRPLEDYLEKWPGIGQEDNPPTELVYEEYQHRVRGDETLAVGQYEGRFPQNYEALVRLVSTGAVQTTAVFRTRNISEFSAGQSIDDFDLLSKLGRGAFASVFLARQKSMQRLVALKISADQGLEGQTLAQLDHPHIVRVFDQRVLREENLRLMYMEYIAGGSLLDVIKQIRSDDLPLNSSNFLKALDQLLEKAGQSRPVESANRDWIHSASWSQVVSHIGGQLSSALEYAHQLEVLHRDLKPANVLVDGHGYPKLVDFNVSFSNKVAGATAASFLGGSIAYMSAEQLEACSPNYDRAAGDLTGSCDVFSLGILLFELLTGQRPFNDLSGFDMDKSLPDLIRNRQIGLPEESKRKLDEHEFLLGEAIERSLAPTPETRISPESLKRQLKWAADSSIDGYLTPPESGWRSWVAKFPFSSVLVVSFAIAMFATWFIVSYNVSEAIAEEDEALYQRVRRVINFVSFNGGMIALFLMFRHPLKVLRNPSEKHSAETIQAAIHANLSYGHRSAVLFVVAWSVAGMMYPVNLEMFGADLQPSAWYDFIGSHILAGLITAAYVFCGVTCLSLSVWHPRIVRAAMSHDVLPKKANQIDVIRSRVTLYQVLAVATPMVAIAMLVNWRQSADTFTLGVLSTGALVGLVILGWTLKQIHQALAIVEKMD